MYSSGRGVTNIMRQNSSKIYYNLLYRVKKTMTDTKKIQPHSSPEHKSKVLWEIFIKLKKASQVCGEIDLPLFGEILLMKYKEIASELVIEFMFKPLYLLY